MKMWKTALLLIHHGLEQIGAMQRLATTRYVLIAALFVVFPIRLDTDHAGKLIVTGPYALAKSGPGSDGDGGDDGEGDDGRDDGEGDDGGDDGEGDDGGDDGEGDDGGDDGEGDYGGDDGEGDYGGDDGEGDDGGDDGEGDYGRDDGEADDRRNDGEADVGDDDEPRPVKVQKVANGALIQFSDGSREEIRNGQFVRTNRNGDVVERRRARSSDLVRMRALFGGQKPQSDVTPKGVNSRAVKATYRGQNVEILYSNGWTEEISSGRYNLADQYGRIVASRRATQADRTRLNRFRK